MPNPKSTNGYVKFSCPASSTVISRSPCSTTSPSLAARPVDATGARRDERMLHLHRLDHRQRAGRTRRRRPRSTASAISRPCIGATTSPESSLAPAGAAGQRIDPLDQDLPAAAQHIGGVADPASPCGAGPSAGAARPSAKAKRRVPPASIVDQPLRRGRRPGSRSQPGAAPSARRNRRLAQGSTAGPSGGGAISAAAPASTARSIGRSRLGAEPRRVGVDEADVDRARRHLGVGEQRGEKGEIGLRPDDDRLADRGAQSLASADWRVGAWAISLAISES